MTTPERLRRRQRRESAGIAVLAAGLIAAVLYFEGQDDAQRECINSYMSANSQTSALRSKLVERESQATRRFLLNATDPEKVQTREQFRKVRATYAKAIASIDEAREANPVQPFPEGVCD